MANIVNSGQLDRRVTFLRPVQSFSPMHEIVTSFVDDAEVWAGRVDQGGSEGYRAQEISAELTLLLTVRYLAATRRVDPRWRVRVEGRDYDITKVRQVMGRRRFLELECVARAEAEVEALDDVAPLDTVLRRRMSAGLTFPPVCGPTPAPENFGTPAGHYQIACNYLPGT